MASSTFKDAVRFVKIWQTSSSVKEVIRRLGKKGVVLDVESACRMAARFRRNGVEVSRFPMPKQKKQYSKRLSSKQWKRLSSLAEGYSTRRQKENVSKEKGKSRHS